jgi:hypothetical protein
MRFTVFFIQQEIVNIYFQVWKDNLVGFTNQLEGQELGLEDLTAMVMKSSIFWNVMLCLPPVFTWVSCLASTLKMEATSSSETSVDFHWTTWCYIPEDKIVQKILTFSASRLLLFSPWS